MPLRRTGSFLPSVARRLSVAPTATVREDPWPHLLAASFPDQARFIEDDAPFVTAVCGRRAGKTNGCAAKLLKAALRKPGSVSLYLTQTRLAAKRIVWRTLLNMNALFGLGAEPNESELRLALPNGSEIFLAGVNDKGEIEKYRGMPLGLVVIDEAQALPGYIQELVDEVIAPALMDYDGAIALIGTPAPVPVGYFYGCATSEQWSHHHWTVFSNPHILRKSGKTPRQHLDRELTRRGIKEDDPIIQREWFGRWVLDQNSLVFAYDSAVNDFEKLPEAKKPWQYVIGVDLGFDDADAIAVLTWNDEFPRVWLVEEWAGPKQTITQLGERLKPLWDKYQPNAVVVDTGGLGKKIAEEITHRTGVPLEAAEKDRKLEHIELLNDALRAGRLFAKRDALFAHDSMLVEWDRSKPEKPKISDRYHSDICDAVLYAYRKSLHWLHEPEPPAPTPEEDMEAATLERMLEEKRAQGYDTEGVGDSSNWEDWTK